MLMLMIWRSLHVHDILYRIISCVLTLISTYVSTNIFEYTRFYLFIFFGVCKIAYFSFRKGSIILLTEMDPCISILFWLFLCLCLEGQHKCCFSVYGKITGDELQYHVNVRNRQCYTTTSMWTTRSKKS